MKFEQRPCIDEMPWVRGMTAPDVIGDTSPISDKLEACRYVRCCDDSQDYDEKKFEICYPGTPRRLNLSLIVFSNAGKFCSWFLSCGLSVVVSQLWSLSCGRVS
jgi:hypothetical protein